MKKILLVLGFALWSSAALAQNTTCSDRAAGDSSNACANTRFVHGAASGSIALGPAQIIVGDSTGVGQARTLTGDCTLSSTGAITCSGSGGGSLYPITPISSSGSVTPNQTYLCDATSGNVTLTLPDASTLSNGTALIVKRKDATDNTCIIQVSGGADIDTLPALGVEPQNTSFTLVADGSSQWWIQ